MAEIKINQEKIRIEGLKKKAEALLAAYPKYTPQWLSLSLDDAKEYL